MCDYSLHAVATRPAKVGETLVTTTFRGTATRGFAAQSDLVSPRVKGWLANVRDFQPSRWISVEK